MPHISVPWESPRTVRDLFPARDAQGTTHTAAQSASIPATQPLANRLLGHLEPAGNRVVAQSFLFQKQDCLIVPPTFPAPDPREILLYR